MRYRNEWGLGEGEQRGTHRRDRGCRKELPRSSRRQRLRRDQLCCGGVEQYHSLTASPASARDGITAKRCR